MRPKGYKCSNVECDRCVGHSMCGELGDAAMNCVDRIITRHTNADRIRAMNDEDMAKWIDWLFGRCEWCDTDKIADDDCNDVECTPCILKWLKQPFEGE